MPIAISCPECASGYRVPDTAAGEAIKCKKCGARVPVAAEKKFWSPRSRTRMEIRRWRAYDTHGC